MTIEQIRELCSSSKIEVTQHMLERMAQRHISFSHVKEAVMNGEIIEEYPNDFPYPSCLLLGIYNKKSCNSHIGRDWGQQALAYNSI